MKEAEIRPKEIFEEYLRLSELDGKKLNHDQFEHISCPACNTDSSSNKFLKNDYNYNECAKCHTLFCSPRPNKTQLDEFYFSSESSKFWSTKFFPAVKEARREKMFKPKAHDIVHLIKEKNLGVKNICDVGAGHGLLLEEISKISSDYKLHAIEPDSDSAAECRKKGIEVLLEVSENATEWHNRFDLVLSLEVMEHVHSPYNFVSSLYDLAKDGGYVLITGLGYEGFDILTLQGKSNSISAPHHLNFLSVQGFEEVFKGAGFKEVEVWTPGKLDVDIVCNATTDNHFINALQRRGEKALKEFQEFLVKHKLSSHTWVLAKK